MARQSITFEWRFAENDPWWDNLPTLGDGRLGGRGLALDLERWLFINLLRGLAVCFVGLVTLAGTAFTPAERERLRVGTSIYAALVRDGPISVIPDLNRFQDRPAGGEGLRLGSTLGVFDASSPSAVQTKLLTVEPIGDLIMAQVWVNYTTLDWRQPTPYHETRFYQETDRGWLQTRPGPTFWGARQIYETDHLRILYYSRDAAQVEPSIADLDHIYLTLHEMVGQQPPTTTLVIAITPEMVTGRGITSQRIDVTSPVMARVPESLTPTAYLSQSIVSRLSFWVVNGYGQEPSLQPFAPEWRGLMRGLRGWLRTDLLGQRWPWDAQAAVFFQEHYQERHPLTLATLTSWSETPWEDDQDRRMWQAGAAETMLNYVVATHSRDRLPALVQGLRQYDTWGELIPAVFEQSTLEFEAGWNRYLTAQFGSEENVE